MQILLIAIAVHVLGFVPILVLFIPGLEKPLVRYNS